MIRCSSCQRDQPIEAFYRDRSNKTTGRTTVCKRCRGAVRKVEHQVLQRELKTARASFADASATELDMGKRFDYGDMLEQQIRAMRLPAPAREFRFHPERKWRFDVCWPDRKLFVECDGGEFVTGSRRHGGATDTEKFNAAVLLGWTGLRFVGSQVRNGYAIETLEQVFGRPRSLAAHGETGTC
jgi:very-short-patch-repair endonuclease